MMKKKYKILSAAILAWLLPVVVFAQQVQNGLNGSGLRNLFGSGGLTGATSAEDLIVRVLRVLLFFAGGIAVLFLIIGGYWYITSAGNEEQAEKGRKTLINAIIGIVIIVLSYVIINVIVNLVGRRSY
jgi:hypothetical protein